MKKKILAKGIKINTSKIYIGTFVGIDPIDSNLSYLATDLYTYIPVYTNSINEYTGIELKNKEKLFEEDTFKYTKHKGYLYPDFIGKIEFRKGSFGFVFLNSDLAGNFVPFSNIDELEHDFLNHITIHNYEN